MLLAAPALRAIHVSTHVSLAQAVERVNRARVLATIRAADAHLKQLGIDQPRVGVCGLNPHAGENPAAIASCDTNRSAGYCRFQASHRCRQVASASH